MATNQLFSLIETKINPSPGGPPTGAAGGDLAGSYPNPTLSVARTAQLNPTPTAGGKVVFDNGTGYSETAAGTAGQLLQSNGAAAPTWVNSPSAITVPVSEVNGGHGADISGIGNGAVTRTAANTYVTRTLTSSGNGITVTNGNGGAGNPTVALTYGSATNTAVQGNDSRLAPAPTTAGKMVYDTGTAYAETLVGTGVQVLHGGTIPSFSAVALATDVSGLLPEANGGLGSDTSALTAGLIRKTGANTYASTPNGTTSQVLVGGTTPTFGNVPSAALTSVPGANVTGTVPFVAMPTGMVVNTVATGNDIRFPPNPLGPQGRIVYDNTGSYAETAAGTTSQVLIGGTTPSFGAVPFAAIPTGTTSSTVTIGNDTRLPQAPTSAGKVIVDNGTTIGETAVGTAGQVLTSTGAATPVWGNRAGSAVTLMTFSRTGTWNGVTYAGPLGALEGAFNGTSVFPIPWVAPCNGTLKNFYVQAQFSNGGNNGFNIYKSPVATPFTYSSTTAILSLPSGTFNANDTTHSISITAGDSIIVLLTGTTFVGPALHLTAQFEPTNS